MKTRWLVCLVAFLVVLPYLRTLNHEFLLLDDDVNVTSNTELIKDPLTGVGRFWRAPYHDFFIPVTYSAWAFQIALSQWLFPLDRPEDLHASLFHGTNVAIHAVNAVLVFTLLLRLAVVPWAALFGALLFGWHPMQVESVAWVTGLRDLLATFFSLLALLRYFDFIEANKPKGQALQSIFCFGLALLAKPSAMVLPAVAFLLSLLSPKPEAWKKSGRLLTGWIVVALPVVAALPFLQSASRLDFSVPWMARPWLALDAVAFYFRNLLVPWPLVLDYGRSPDVVLSHVTVKEIAKVAVPCLVLGAFVMAYLAQEKKKWRTPAIALGVSLAALAPMLGLQTFQFQQFSTVSDRYFYFAMLGPAIILGWGLPKIPRPGAYLTGGLLAVLGGVTFLQAGFWKNSETLFAHVVATNPRSFLALSNLGVVLERENKNDEAIGRFQQAIKVKPDWPLIRYNLATVLVKEKRYEEAVTEFREVLGSFPRNSSLYVQLGEALSELNRLEEAESAFKKASELRPDLIEAQLHLGWVYSAQGRWGEAKTTFEKVLERDPNNEMAYNNLASSLISLKEPKPGIAILRQGVARLPHSAVLFFDLGLLLEQDRQWKEAELAFRDAIRLNLRHWGARLHLGDVLAKSGKPQEGKRVHEEAFRMEPKLRTARRG